MKAAAATLRPLAATDAIERVNSICPEGRAVHVLEVAALAGGRVHSVVEVRHGGQQCFGSSTLCFDGPLSTHVREYWSTVQAPPAWRTAAAIGAYQKLEPDE